MYKATFKAGWMTIDCESDSLCGLISELNEKQNLNCLIFQVTYMGMGDEEDKEVVSRLEEFCEKWHENDLTEDDIRNMKFVLSIGALVCTKFEVTDET